MSDVPRASATRARTSSSRSPPSPGAEYEFSEEHKESMSSLAASMSFVGVCTVLLGLMSVVFALGAGYAGFAAGGIGLAAGAAVCVPLGWWTASAGRSLSALVRTRGRDVSLMMAALKQLRRLFGFAPVLVVAYAAAVVAIAYYTLLAGGKCFAW